MSVQIPAKIKRIQMLIEKIEKSAQQLSPELRSKLNYIHGEMYGYLRLMSQTDARLDEITVELAEISGDVQVKKH